MTLIQIHSMIPITIRDYLITGGTDFSYFGGYAQRKPGPLGGSIIYYNINISRYIQRMLISQGANYEMRLFPAFDFHYPQYSTAYLPFNNSVALGRVRVGSGTNPNLPCVCELFIHR